MLKDEFNPIKETKVRLKTSINKTSLAAKNYFLVLSKIKLFGGNLYLFLYTLLGIVIQVLY
jgi:hypothetical protein